jgi:hypothetical protein
MTLRDGEMFKNRITEGLFRIRKVEDQSIVMLEDPRGFVQIWLPKDGVESLFEKRKGVC